MTFVVIFMTNVIKEMSISKKYKKEAVGYASMDDRNALSVVSTVREGVPYYGFHSILENTPFSLDEWSSYLHISERTLQRYKKESKTFEPMQSERIVQIIQLYYYGIEVFGKAEKFDEWLATKNVALGNRIPKNLLDSAFGIGVIKDELGRIEHGILA